MEYEVAEACPVNPGGSVTVKGLCRIVDKNTLLSLISGIPHAQPSHYIVESENFATEPPLVYGARSYDFPFSVTCFPCCCLASSAKRYAAIIAARSGKICCEAAKILCTFQATFAGYRVDSDPKKSRRILTPVSS
jgi:hypothetical protein